MQLTIIDKEERSSQYNRQSIENLIEELYIKAEQYAPETYIVDNFIRSLEGYFDYHQIKEISKNNFNEIIADILIDGPSKEVAKKFIKNLCKEEIIELLNKCSADDHTIDFLKYEHEV